MKVNVSDEGSDKVRWYKARRSHLLKYGICSISLLKERFLAEDEIIEHVVVSLHSVITNPDKPNLLRIIYRKMKLQQFSGQFIDRSEDGIYDSGLLHSLQAFSYPYPASPDPLRTTQMLL